MTMSNKARRALGTPQTHGTPVTISPEQQAINARKRLAAHEESLRNARANLRDAQSRLANSETAAARGDGVLGSPRLADELRFRIEGLQRNIASLEERCVELADWRA